VLAVISFVLLVGGLAIGVALGGVPPSPFAAAPSVTDFFVSHPVAVQVAAVGVFRFVDTPGHLRSYGSARLRQLGVTAPGATIALAGGVWRPVSWAWPDSAVDLGSRPEVTARGPWCGRSTSWRSSPEGPPMCGARVAGRRMRGAQPNSRVTARWLAWTGL